MVAPLLPAPPTLVDPVSGTRVWFFAAQRTVVDQTITPMTLDVARFITGPVEAEVQRRWVQAGQTVRFIHDWRSCVSYEAKARDLLIEWGRGSAKHAGEVVLQLSPDASPFVRIAAQTGIGLLRMMKMKIELVDSLEPFVKELSAYAPG